MHTAEADGCMCLFTLSIIAMRFIMIWKRTLCLADEYSYKVSSGLWTLLIQIQAHACVFRIEPKCETSFFSLFLNFFQEIVAEISGLEKERDELEAQLKKVVLSLILSSVFGIPVNVASC